MVITFSIMAEDSPKKKSTFKKVAKKKSAAKKKAVAKKAVGTEEVETPQVEDVKPVVEEKAPEPPKVEKVLSAEEKLLKSLEERCKDHVIAQTAKGNIRHHAEADSPQARRRLQAALSRKENDTVKFFWNDKFSK